MDIKICGIRTIEDIKTINKYEISYAGFIFAEKSKRKVSIQEAVKLRTQLRKDIKAVGVFVHTGIDKINCIAEKVGLDIIQLHSDETNEDCKKSERPVWKMISIKNNESVEQAEKYTNAQGILLDTYSKGLLGGTGETFNWEYVNNLSQKYFIILAGGLNATNIVKAAEYVKPHVLDINSGVETDGKKDENKIMDLVGRLKNGIR